MRYNLAVARELPVFRPIPYVARGRRASGTETEAMLVAVGNGPSYGGGMRVCPDADLDDGLLDVLVVHEISIPAFLRVLPEGLRRHARAAPGGARCCAARRVRLEATGIVAYADGERFGPLPLDLRGGAGRAARPRRPR